MAARHGFIAMVVLALVTLLVALVGLNSVLDASADEGGSKGVPIPLIPRGRGDSCVDDTDFMRRYHMVVLQKQHDETSSTGIISTPYSIKECVSCHAVLGPNARPVSADKPEHFCRLCHDYVAVTIDCFECHRSRRRPPAAG